MPRKTEIPFDINQRFSVLGDLRPTLTNEENSINQSIENIMMTRIGTRFRNREFGSGFQDLLFEPLSENTAFRILNELGSSIERWDPRVLILLNESEILVEQYKRRYNIKIRYKRVRTNDIKEFRVAVPVAST